MNSAMEGPSPAHPEQIAISADSLASLPPPPPAPRQAPKTRLAGRTPRRAAEGRVLVAIGLLAVLTGVILVSPYARILQYLFPLMAAIVALYASRLSVRLYLAFSIWLWILTPFVRRLVDFRAGWIPATLVLLAPYLAAIVPIFEIIPHLRRVLTRHSLPVAVIAAVSVYGCAAGLFNYGGSVVFQDLLLWLAPMVILLYIFLHREELTAVYSGIESAFTWGLIVLGVYGILQFFLLPKWDVLWMTRMALASIGPPEPLKVRIFSTMNSPQVLASYLTPGVLLQFGSRSKLRFLSIPVALIALLLSLARSGWLALIVGVAFLIFFLSNRQRATLLLVGMLSVVAFFAASLNPDVSKVLTSRFDSFSSLSQDNSYMDRTEGYRAFVDSLVQHPFGLGMGTAASQEKDDTIGLGKSGKAVYMGDSAIVTIFTSLGIAGALVYAIALGILLFHAFSGSSASRQGARPIQAALLGILLEAPLMDVLAGPTGYLLWLFLGLLLAQRAVFLERRAYPVLPVPARNVPLEAL